MNRPERARQTAAKALLKVFSDDASPFTEQERALHCIDAICYYVSVVYQLPIPMQRSPDHPVYSHGSAPPDVVQQIREIVDEDVTDPADWYRIILKIRELVGVTR